MYRIGALLGAWLMCTGAFAASQVGFRQMTLTDSAAERPLETVVFYPTEATGPSTVVGENPAFEGIAVQKDAQPSPGAHPLVVISHGFGGNWRNQLWLAQALVQQGYIVAAPNHPGTTTTNRDKPAAAKLWLRPDDIRRAITAIEKNADLWRVAPGRIAVIGHSLGGWTALELAGARFNPQQFETDCQTQKALIACSLYQDIGAGKSAQARELLYQSARDARVTAIVSLDLGLARGFTPQSLAAIAVPVLIIAAGYPNPQLPAQAESHFMAQKMPASSTVYQEISDATHFSFMQLCKPGAVDMIEKADPGDGVICLDGGDRSREQIHQQVIEAIARFLTQAWR